MAEDYKKLIKEIAETRDYNIIDQVIDKVIILNNPKIFEKLLDGCCLKDCDYEYETQVEGFKRPVLNEWMKLKIISEGMLDDQPSGYYIFLCLWLNAPDNAKIDKSLNKNDLIDLNLKYCHLKRLPPNFSKISNIKKLDLSNNNLKEFPDQTCLPINIELLNVNKNPIDDINSVPQNISKLKNLKVLLAGNCNDKEEFENNLDWKRIPIPKDFSTDIKIIDLGLDYEARGFDHTDICGVMGLYSDGRLVISGGCCRNEFHKSNLIIRYDRINCKSCDDPDELTFSCEICDEYFASFINYNVDESDNNLLLESMSLAKAKDDDQFKVFLENYQSGSADSTNNYDSRYAPKYNVMDGGGGEETVCFNCRENIDSSYSIVDPDYDDDYDDDED